MSNGAVGCKPETIKIVAAAFADPT